MEGGLDAHDELTRERLLRRLAAFIAEGKIVLDPLSARFSSVTERPWKVTTSRRLMTSPWKRSASGSYSTTASYPL